MRFFYLGFVQNQEAKAAGIGKKNAEEFGPKKTRRIQSRERSLWGDVVFEAGPQLDVRFMICPPCVFLSRLCAKSGSKSSWDW